MRGPPNIRRRLLQVFTVGVPFFWGATGVHVGGAKKHFVISNYGVHLLYGTTRQGRIIYPKR